VVAVAGVFVYSLTSFISTPMLLSLAKSLNINMFNPGTGIGRAITFFFFDILLYPIFGAIGGLLGAGVFWKKPQS